MTASAKVPRRVKRNPPSGTMQGAHVRTEAEKPACPQHLVKAKYDPEDGRWHCPFQGCQITFYQRGDHVNSSMGNYEGPLSVVHDRRTGKVWLRLAGSDDNGRALMVLLTENADDPVSMIGGVNVVDINPNGAGGVMVHFEDTVTINHSGRVRR